MSIPFFFKKYVILNNKMKLLIKLREVWDFFFCNCKEAMIGKEMKPQIQEHQKSMQVMHKT